jgi:hypothetical protein
VDPNSRVIKFFNKIFELERKLNQCEFDRLFATVSRRMEVAFSTKLTDCIAENLLCKTLRVLSKSDQKQVIRWCDTLLPQQQLYQFNANSTLVISANGLREEVEGDAIINRFLYCNQLLTMAELISELQLNSTIPTESRRRKYRIPRKVWCRKVKFDVEFNIPVVGPLLTKGMETKAGF